MSSAYTYHIRSRVGLCLRRSKYMLDRLMPACSAAARTLGNSCITVLGSTGNGFVLDSFEEISQTDRVRRLREPFFASITLVPANPPSACTKDLFWAIAPNTRFSSVSGELSNNDGLLTRILWWTLGDKSINKFSFDSRFAMLYMRIVGVVRTTVLS